MELDKRMINIIVLGIGFMTAFTAFQTCGNIEKIVLDSIRKDDPSFTGDGYISLAVLYAVFAVCNWGAPSFISVAGPRLSMVIGSLCYGFFIASFLAPSNVLLYIASGVVGFGAAILWAAQGSYLTLNSDSATIQRNSGLFWAMFQVSMFAGNIFVTLEFAGKSHIDAESRTLVFTVLTSLSGLGVILIVCLRPAVRQDGELVSHQNAGPLEAFRTSFKLFTSRNMILLSAMFFYSGLETCFYSGVYGSTIGFTQQLGANSKSLVGMSGIFVGFGEVLGGAIFGIFSKQTTRWGREPIIVFGYILHMLAFFFIFLNIPNAAPFGDTMDEAFIQPNQYLAILCSFLLGLGDSCQNTQIFSILGLLYPDDSAPVFALFKFTQSLSLSLSFVYSSMLGLYVQLGILAVWATFGTICFCTVELSRKRTAIETAGQRSPHNEMKEQQD
uniref:UNC93-like protein MFSD11 n=2 Tax=Cacopsylla melanoneura TaxID=428564 RepID=A0A8D8W830_9HEMI